MGSEFSYSFRRHSIVLTREAEDRNWYIRVRAPSGLYAYDGYWLNSAGKTLKEALYEAKVGAMLIPPAPAMDPESLRAASQSSTSAGGAADEAHNGGER